MLLSRVPATLELALCAAVLALGVGIPMGVYAGIRRNTWGRSPAGGLARRHLHPVVPDRIILILVFSVELNWLPAYGRGRRSRSAVDDRFLQRPA